MNVTPCPDRVVLRALHEGKLAESELDTLASHLESCERCLTVLDEFNGAREIPGAADSPTVGAETPLRSVAPANVAASTRYQVIKPHARGGLGEIFLALDRELHREVALKKIHRRLVANGEASVRFVREAEVTGGLEHPGIAPVYSLGVDADGSQYYAMRFIRGETFRDAIKSFHAAAQERSRSRKRHFAIALQGLEFRKLLQRLIEVCNVIGYAHSRKILHRDIKPANVMLGRYGETLVVDWGLARPIGAVETPSESSLGPLVSGDGELSLTRDGAIVGTPAYMSPEQAAGRLQDTTVRSDIYSLGATLYMILAGRPPFVEDNVARLLEQVVKGAFPPPRKVQPGAPRRLEAICLKAMSLDPAQRYASCEALVDDLERYLADQPVSAMPDPFSSRMFRWMRRHRTLVTSGVAAVAVAAVILSITIGLLAKANHDLVQTNRREKDATQRAQQTYELAKTALDDVVELKNDPRFQSGPLEDVRLHLQRVESGFYEKFVDLKGDDPFFQYQRARAIYELARLKTRFGASGDSITELRAAVEILASDYSRARSKLPLAECQHNLANAYRRAGNNAQALKTYQLCISNFQELLRESPDNADYLNRLARVQKNLAGVFDALGQHDEAGKLLLETLRTREPLLAAQPGNERLQNDLASTYRDLGWHHLYNGQPVESEPYLAKAEAMYQTLVEGNPTNEEFQSNLASCLAYLAMTAEKRKAPADAETAWLKAIALCESLTELHPQILGYRINLASNYARLGNHYQLLRNERAIEAYSNALQVLGSLDAKETARALPLLASTRTNLAMALGVLGRDEEKGEQETLLERDLARVDEITLPPPELNDEEQEPRAQAAADEALVLDAKSLAGLYRQRAGFHARRGEWKEAAADNLRAAEIEPDQQYNSYVAGPALLLAGDTDGYRQVCRDAVQRFSNTQDPVLAERTGKLCLLTAQPEELERAVRLTDLAVERGSDHPLRAWFGLAQGLAAYRQGRLEDSIRILSALTFLPEHRSGADFANLLLAMAKVKLEAGEEELELLKRALAANDARPQQKYGYDIDWQFFEVLRREAEPLLKATPSGE